MVPCLQHVLSIVFWRGYDVYVSHAYIYVQIYACTYTYMYMFMYICIYTYKYLERDVCAYACMYSCMYVMYVCMYVGIHIHICVCVRACVCLDEFDEIKCLSCLPPLVFLLARLGSSSDSFRQSSAPRGDFDYTRFLRIRLFIHTRSCV